MSNGTEHPEVQGASSEITAEKLVGLIANAGPGGKIDVRSRYLPDGTTRTGNTSYNSDLVMGPAVLFYEKPDQSDFVTSVLPLGGQLVYLGPPRFNTLGDYRMNRMIASSADTSKSTGTVAYRTPIDSFTQENYRFEVLPE